MYEINVKISLPDDYEAESVDLLGNQIDKMVVDMIDWFVYRNGYHEQGIYMDCTVDEGV